MFSCSPHRHGDGTGIQKNMHFVRYSLQCLHVRHVTNRLECYKVPRLPRKTTWQPAWEPSKRRGFAASPIDTAKPQGNQRRETWHVGAPKRAFRARRPPIFTFCSVTSDIFLDFLAEPLNFTTAKSMFPARLLSIFSTCHKMPRLPQNLHLVATWRSPANAICKKHATLKVCIQLSEGARLNYTLRTVVLSDPQSRLIIAVSQYSSRICFPASPTDTRRRDRKTRDSRQDTWMQKNMHFVRYSLQCLHVRHVTNRLECYKVPRLPRKTTWQPAWEPSKRRGFAASPIDTAKPQGTRDAKHDTWEHQNEHFVRDLLQFAQFRAERTCFAAFPRRHSEATREPMTRDKTSGSTKTSISRETASNFHIL